jgi:uncharacterized delta-60 repeat protein
MTGIITLVVAGSDTGPFNLYSNADGYLSAFASSVTRAQLLAGYITNDLPAGTTLVKVKSLGVCTNFIEVVVPPITCYNFLPTNNYYTLDYIAKQTYSYFYGFIQGYIENDIVTPFKNLIKLNPDLTVDQTFNVGTGFNQILYSGSSIIEQPDGKIIVTGTFTTYQGISYNRIIRLNIDGSIDTTFVVGTGFTNFTQEVALDSQNRILVTGIYGSYNGYSSPRIIRLLPNGSPDTSFVTGTGFNNTTTGVLVNSDDSVIVSGYFSGYNGSVIGPGLAKLLSDGTIDPTFDVGAGVFPYVPNNANYLLKIPGETSFYLYGYVSVYKGVIVNNIVKIQQNGDIDNSLDTGLGFNGVTIYLANIIWGDKLLLEGDFTTYKGVTTLYSVIINKDGSILYAFDQVYMSPVVIGNNLFAAKTGECLELLYSFVP